jgi:hypothetical protein
MDKKPESLYAQEIAVIRKILMHNLGSIFSYQIFQDNTLLGISND